MDLVTIPQKQLQELEVLLTGFLLALKKAKIQDAPFADSLEEFKGQLEATRRARFDAENSHFQGY
jgi:hypothetical protein